MTQRIWLVRILSREHLDCTRQAHPVSEAIELYQREFQRDSGIRPTVLRLGPRMRERLVAELDQLSYFVIDTRRDRYVRPSEHSDLSFLGMRILTDPLFDLDDRLRLEGEKEEMP